jgi:hypothetical protein
MRIILVGVDSFHADGEKTAMATNNGFSQFCERAYTRL